MELYLTIVLFSIVILAAVVGVNYSTNCVIKAMEQDSEENTWTHNRD